MSASVVNVSAAGAPVALVLGGEAEIFLYGMIGEYGISAGAFVERLRAIDRSVSVLHLRVNSMGGSVDDARAMATALYEWPGKVIAHVDGVAASAAAFLVLAADEIWISDGAFLMLHAPWTFTLGDAGDHDRAAVLLRKYEDSLVSAYVRRTDVDEETVRGWMAEETWFGADEAVTVGLADRVVPSVAEGEAAALASGLVFDLSAFRQVPAALVRRFQRKEQSSMSQQNAPASRAYNVTGGVPASQLPSASGGAPAPPGVQAQGAAAPPDAIQAAILAERDRTIDITRIGEGLNLPAAIIQSAINTGVRTDDFRRVALEERFHLDQANNIRSGNRSAHMSVDYGENTRMAFQQAISAKLFEPAKNIDERFRGLKLVEMVQAYHEEMGYPPLGRDVSEAAGQVVSLISRTGFSSGGVRGAAQPTSDFPAILANSLNKRLLDIYEAAPAALKVIARVREAPDFRSLSITRLSEYPSLDPVAESAAITQGTMSDYAGGYAVAAYGRIVSVTRQALVNDDLSAFQQLPRAGAQASVDREANLLVGVLSANAGLGQTLTDDAKTLFHADHANLAAAGGAIDDTTLGAARLSMRLQKGIGGVQPIDALPKFLVVPAALETTAQKYLATLQPAAAANVNVFAGQLQLVVEPRLDAISASRWYLAADPLLYACLEIAYLEGWARPRVETEVREFDTDAFRMKVVLDVGAGAVDFRGMYMNPGPPVIP